jgi:hypothetical protein
MMSVLVPTSINMINLGAYRVRLPESRRWNSVLKLKWRWARERPENELLQLANESCVWDAVSLNYYKEGLR